MDLMEKVQKRNKEPEKKHSKALSQPGIYIYIILFICSYVETILTLSFVEDCSPNSSEEK